MPTKAQIEAKRRADEERAAEASAAETKHEPVQKTLGESHAQVAGSEVAAEDVSDDTVTMVFPRAVQLTLDNHNHIKFPEGLNEVPAELADHWYLKAHGVRAYEKRKKIEE